MPVRSLPPRLYLAQTPFAAYKNVSKALEDQDISVAHSLRNSWARVRAMSARNASRVGRQYPRAHPARH